MRIVRVLLVVFVFLTISSVVSAEEPGRVRDLKPYAFLDFLQPVFGPDSYLGLGLHLPLVKKDRFNLGGAGLGYTIQGSGGSGFAIYLPVIEYRLVRFNESDVYFAMNYIRGVTNDTHGLAVGFSFGMK